MPQKRFGSFAGKQKYFSSYGSRITVYISSSTQCTNYSYTDGTIVLQNWAEHVTCMGQQKYIQSLAENLNKRSPPPPGAKATSGPGPPHQTALHDHINLDITHLVGVLWTDDQPDAYTSTRQNKTVTRQTSMPPAGFEPAIPASQQP